MHRGGSSTTAGLVGLEASERTGARLAAFPGAVEARTWMKRFSIPSLRELPSRRSCRGVDEEHAASLPMA